MVVKALQERHADRQPATPRGSRTKGKLSVGTLVLPWMQIALGLQTARAGHSTTKTSAGTPPHMTLSNEELRRPDTMFNHLDIGFGY